MTSNSIINNNDVYITQLATPLGLSLNSVPSLECKPGLIAYDISSDNIYTGRVATGSTWQVIANGATGLPVTLLPVGAIPSADGASITTDQKLTLQPADATHPGVLTSTAQTIGGVKTFNGGIASNITGMTAGVTSLLNRILIYDFLGISATGGITAGPQLAALRSTGFENFLHMGPLTQVGAVGGIITLSKPVPPEFQSGTLWRTASVMVIDNNVFSIGAMRVDGVTGVITIGKTIDASGVLTAFTGGAGNTGWLDNVAVFSQY